MRRFRFARSGALFHASILLGAFNGLLCVTSSAAGAAEQLRVYAGSCAFSSHTLKPTPAPNEAERMSPIVATLLSSFVDVGIDALGAALTRAGQDKTYQYEGTTNVVLDQKERIACVQMIRAEFLSNPDMVLSSTASKQWAAVNPEVFNGIKTKSMPSFVLEVEVHYSTDNAAVALRPSRLIYGGESKRAKARDVLVYVAVSDPLNLSSESASFGSAAAVTRIRFDGLKPGTDYVPVSAEREPASPWMPLTLQGQSKPKVVWVRLVETEDGNKFLAFLGDVFSGAKPGLKEGIKNEVIPDKREAARLASAQGMLTLRLAAATKLNDAIVKQYDARLAEQAYCALSFEERATSATFSGLLTKLTAANAAMQQANIAALAAGQDEPFGGAGSMYLFNLPRNPGEVSCE